MEVQPALCEEIRVAESTDPLLGRIRTKVLAEKAPGFVIHEDSVVGKVLIFINPKCKVYR